MNLIDRMKVMIGKKVELPEIDMQEDPVNFLTREELQKARDLKRLEILEEFLLEADRCLKSTIRSIERQPLDPEYWWNETSYVSGIDQLLLSKEELIYLLYDRYEDMVPPLYKLEIVSNSGLLFKMKLSLTEEV